MSKGYKKEQVLEAVKGSAAIMSTIARRLNCDWHTANKYVNKWAETRAAHDSEDQKILDFAEGTLYESIKGGNTQDAKWLLSKRRKGKYSEKKEVALTVTDMTKLTDDELRSIIES